jgi:hypothetical protein
MGMGISQIITLFFQEVVSLPQSLLPILVPEASHINTD